MTFRTNAIRPRDSAWHRRRHWCRPARRPHAGRRSPRPLRQPPMLSKYRDVEVTIGFGDDRAHVAGKVPAQSAVRKERRHRGIVERAAMIKNNHVAARWKRRENNK